MGILVNLDGALVGAEQAFISVFDRGFLYGDSVYEVVRTYAGVPFELEAHLDRLEHSAALIGLELPWPRERIAAELRRTVAASGNPECYVRIIVTRGAGELGLDPGLGRDGRVILIAKELEVPPAESYARGVTLALVDVRRNLRAAVDPAAKTGNYLNSVLAMRQARALGAFEGLMLDRDGRITEAASANVFIVVGGELLTPPLEVGILEGVTRRVVIALAGQLGIPFREAELRPEQLLAADEVFITSTTRELVPVVRIVEASAEHRVGTGTPGPLTGRLLAAFRARTMKVQAER